MKEFTAVLLAGGKSSRMGTDKALLPWRGGTLLEHQLDTLRATAPSDLWISARDPEKYSACHVETICDRGEAIGPLGGIVAALEECGTPLLLVLAVDMPATTAGFLLSLLDDAEQSCGILARRDARLEPLAAVYPRAALPFLQSAAKGADYSMQFIARDLCARGLLSVRELTPAEWPLFRNVNLPADVADAGDRSRDSTRTA